MVIKAIKLADVIGAAKATIEIAIKVIKNCFVFVVVRITIVMVMIMIIGLAWLPAKQMI